MRPKTGFSTRPLIIQPELFELLEERGSTNQSNLKLLSTLEMVQNDVNAILLTECVPDKPIQFADYVPRDHQGYLNKHFVSWVMRIPVLRKMSFKLEEQGYTKLGDVIQLSEAEIRERSGATDKAIDALNAELAKVDFHLGMKVTGWKRGPELHSRDRS